jgi:hypothetical protein
MKSILIACIPLAALVGCKTAEIALKEAGKKSLTADQIQKVVAGNTFIGIGSSDFTSFLRKNGTIKVISRGREDTGTWHVKQPNEMCTKYTWIRNGQENCRRYYKIDGGYQSVQLDGSASSTFKIVSGNLNNF